MILHNEFVEFVYFVDSLKVDNRMEVVGGYLLYISTFWGGANSEIFFFFLKISVMCGILSARAARTLRNRCHD